MPLHSDRRRRVAGVAFVGTFLLVAAGFGLALSANTAFASVEAGAVDTTITDEEVDRDASRLRLTVRVENPTDADLRIVDADGRVLTGNRMVASGPSVDPVTVPAGGTATVDLSMHLVTSTYDDVADEYAGDATRYVGAFHVRIANAETEVGFGQRGPIDG